MSVVLSNSRKQVITLLKADLNYRLMIIASRMQRTAAESQSITEEKNKITNRELEKLMDDGVENISVADVKNIAYMTAELDTDLTLLALKDDDMEAEMKMIETELQALNAEEEEIDKLTDKSIKNEFGIFK